MMKSIKVAILLVALIFFSCNEKIITEPSSSKGKVQLSFDKENIPEDVVLISALLSRNGFEPISASLNVLSPNTAEILIENLAVGVWHLQVDARDVNNTIIYSGETDIEIIANTTIPISLTLFPSGSSTGSVLITVTWGTYPSDWIDFANNPVLEKQFNSMDIYGVGYPQIIKEDQTYKMWYQARGLSNELSYVFFATSTDGINWNVHSTPVLFPGNNLAWDSGRAGIGPVIKVDETYKMYYNGFENSNEIWHVGLATSSDGINWTKSPNPVLSGRINQWDEKITANHIEKIDNVYFMYFTGFRNGWDYKIGLATSTDGLNWTRYDISPIMALSQSWEDDGVGFPTIIKEDNIYKMIYHETTPSNNGFGLATSVDGITWEKSLANPVFTTLNTSQNWIKIGYPFLLKDNDELKLFYSGFDENLIMNINFATYQE